MMPDPEVPVLEPGTKVRSDPGGMHSVEFVPFAVPIPEGGDQ